MQDSKIQWCDHTWNPWRGCTKVSPGCLHCYAEAGAKRNPAILGDWGPFGTRIVGVDSCWDLPLRWHSAAVKAGRIDRVFSLSLGDWLEDWPGPMRDCHRQELYLSPSGDWVPKSSASASAALGWRPLTMVDVRARLLVVISRTPALEYLLLSKRCEGWRDRMREIIDLGGDAAAIARLWCAGSPPPNVRVGTSIENQDYLSRLSDLRRIPGVNFVSFEPLLGPIHVDGLRGIDWAIIGGESGDLVRPCSLDWVGQLAFDLRLAGVPVFVKQLGPFPIDSFYSFLDPKGGDPNEWPENLRIREWPVPASPASEVV